MISIGLFILATTRQEQAQWPRGGPLLVQILGGGVPIKIQHHEWETWKLTSVPEVLQWNYCATHARGARFEYLDFQHT